MKQFIIDEDLAQAVANYLSARPYREVAGLIGGLLSLQECPRPRDGEEKKSKDQ